MKIASPKFILAAIVTLGAVVTSNAAVPFTDNFNTAHNYFTNGVTGTGWDGIINASGLDSGAQNTGGILNWTNAAGTSRGWENAQNNAPFLYVNVTGDFSASVEGVFAGSSTGSFATGGIMAHAPNGGAPNDDWLTLTYGAWQNSNMIRDTTNGITAFSGYQSPKEDFLRMDRVGNTFNFYTKATAGASWDLLSSVSHTMPATLEVGLQFGMFDAAAGQVRYDNFAVVPEPTSAFLAATGFGLVAMRRRRR